MIVESYKDASMPTLKNYTNNNKYNSIESIKEAVWKGDAWAAVFINEGFGNRLEQALTEGTDYNPEEAVTVLTEESRHYFKAMTVNKGVQNGLTALEGPFAKNIFKQLLESTDNNALAVVSRANSEALITPFTYKVENVAPYHFDLSMYILSVTLSLCMVVGSFIPSNMWKSIEEPFFKQVRILQLIALRAFINVLWAIIICLQATGIVFLFRGSAWSPSVGDFFAIFAILLLNTLAFTFFIDCMQNLVHPRFLLGGYFMTLFVNISAAVFGTELNSHFFRISYAMPFHNTGLMLRTLLTDGSYNKLDFAITINILWTLFWWVISAFLISRKARLVQAGKMTMSNVPPPPSTPPPPAEDVAVALDVEGVNQEVIRQEKREEEEEYLSSASISPTTTPGASESTITDRHKAYSASDLEIEDE
ncbi:hypothetical protein H4S08_003285 [Coemansia sp. RSA 1365]|nr:hypothetical protein H4S08_003285 [Coemansia sp. RSA 1365]